MEQIARLMSASPSIFHRIVSKTDPTTTFSFHLECQVDHNCIACEDDINDMFQAVIDICCGQIALNQIESAVVILMFPDTSSMDVVFDVARKYEIHKRTSNTLNIKKTYFDSNEGKFKSYVSEARY